MTKAIEFLSIMFLGVLLILAFTHLLNGTFTEWLGSKFFTRSLDA